MTICIKTATGDLVPVQTLEQAIEAAVLAEREACAKVCDEFGEWRDTSGVDCAASIRGRGMDLLTQHSQNIGEYDER